MNADMRRNALRYSARRADMEMLNTCMLNAIKFLYVLMDKTTA
jgi:hypothetical protein